MRGVGGILVWLAWIGTASICAAGQGDELMAFNAETVWLTCGFDPESAAVPGFCDKLRTDFARVSGFVLGNGGMAPDGGIVLDVTLQLRRVSRATVTLRVGRQADGALAETGREVLRLGSVDADLRAGAAAALVYPMVKLLEKAR